MLLCIMVPIITRWIQSISVTFLPSIFIFFERFYSHANKYSQTLFKKYIKNKICHENSNQTLVIVIIAHYIYNKYFF